MKTNKKAILALLLALTMLLCAACSGGEEPAEEPAGEPAGEPAETEEPEVPDFTEYNALAKESYLFCVEEFKQTKTLPNGREIDVFGYGYDDWTNRYAIYDIDRDGKDELILRIADTDMASTGEFIYAYDEEGDALIEELWASPICNYYNDGLTITSYWSHGSGWAPDGFWPFNAFVYDPETDVYEFIGFADACSLDLMTELEVQDQFPAEADEDGNGIVYTLSDESKGGSAGDVDDSVYLEWVAPIFGDGSKVDLPWVEIELE